jgi:hypothetical protein
MLLTNYMMLELLLTRNEDRELVRAAHGLRYLVFDELHTYRGRQGADVALLIRRCRLAFGGDDMICVGTSATMASSGSTEDQKREVTKVAQTLFGVPFDTSQVIGETLAARRTDVCSLLSKGGFAGWKVHWTLDRVQNALRRPLIDLAFGRLELRQAAHAPVRRG